MAAVSINQYNAENPDIENQVTGSLDENGNFVDEEGNILITAEELAKQAEEAPVATEAEEDVAEETAAEAAE